MISSALVQHADDSRIPEMREAATELERRGVPVRRFHAKHLLRRRVPLAPQTQQTGHGAAYAIDFGVLRDGRTALLDVNDGYSLGTCGCPPEISVEVLITRWTELVSHPGSLG
jgi:hypothetical protein